MSTHVKLSQPVFRTAPTRWLSLSRLRWLAPLAALALGVVSCGGPDFEAGPLGAVDVAQGEGHPDTLDAGPYRAWRPGPSRSNAAWRWRWRTTGLSKGTLSRQAPTSILSVLRRVAEPPPVQWPAILRSSASLARPAPSPVQQLHQSLARPV